MHISILSQIISRMLKGCLYLALHSLHLPATFWATCSKNAQLPVNSYRLWAEVTTGYVLASFLIASSLSAHLIGIVDEHMVFLSANLCAKGLQLHQYSSKSYSDSGYTSRKIVHFPASARSATRSCTRYGNFFLCSCDCSRKLQRA